MTDQKNPTLLQRLDALKVPHAIVIAAALGFLSALTYAIPEAHRGEVVLYVVGLVITTVTGVALPSVFRQGGAPSRLPVNRVERAPIRLDPDDDLDEDDDDSEAGFAAHDAIGYLALFGLCTLAAWRLFGPPLLRALGLWAVLLVALPGCGGALLAQARAATIATVALEGGRRMMVQVAEERSAACEDEVCVLQVREDMRPAEAAYEGLRLTVSSWVSSLDVAHLAGIGEEILEALVTAGLRFVVDWGTFATALRGVGVELPQLPDVLLADVGGAR